MISKIPFLLIILVFISISCINNVEDLSSDVVIQPDDISYSSDIQTIFNQSCGGGACHINTSTNGVNLSSYTAVMNSIGSSYNSQVVIIDNPNTSPLVDKIEANPDIGSRMPLTGGYLTTDEINKIRTWIESGAKDN